MKLIDLQEASYHRAPKAIANVIQFIRTSSGEITDIKAPPGDVLAALTQQLGPPESTTEQTAYAFATAKWTYKTTNTRKSVYLVYGKNLNGAPHADLVVTGRYG